MKTYGILGAILFALTVVAGAVFSFPGAVIIEIALAAFALCAVIIGAIKDANKKGLKLWKTVVIIILASISGILCCIGGLNQNIFAEISGAVLALLAVIFGLYYKRE